MKRISHAPSSSQHIGYLSKTKLDYLNAQKDILEPTLKQDSPSQRISASTLGTTNRLGSTSDKKKTKKTSPTVKSDTQSEPPKSYTPKVGQKRYFIDAQWMLIGIPITLGIALVFLYQLLQGSSKEKVDSPTNKNDEPEFMANAIDDRPLSVAAPSLPLPPQKPLATLATLKPFLSFMETADEDQRRGGFEELLTLAQDPSNHVALADHEEFTAYLTSALAMETPSTRRQILECLREIATSPQAMLQICAASRGCSHRKQSGGRKVFRRPAHFPWLFGPIPCGEFTLGSNRRSRGPLF